MPNWCSTSYTIDGDKKQLKKLYNVLLAAEDPAFKVFSDFDYWLGNIPILLGENPLDDKTNWDCRGWIECMDKDDDDIIYLSTESAWSPSVSMFNKIIDDYFPGLDFTYIAEEPGCGLYMTNDPDYDKMYHCDVGIKDGDTFFDDCTYDGIKNFIEKKLGKNFEGFDDLLKYLSELDLESEDCIVEYYSIEPYAFVERTDI